MNSKTFFIGKVIEAAGSRARVLEMGCGTARYMPTVLDAYPDTIYVGLEPYGPSFKQAEVNIGSRSNVTLYNQLGYGTIEGVEKGSFDVVYSMSALEHVKDLRAFITMSAEYLKLGGLLVHRYDLGHALYPSSLKEKFQVFLGNNFPQVLGEHKFVRYVPQSEVEGHFDTAGCEVTHATYHQMPNHKSLEKLMDTEGITETMADVYEWEWKHKEALPRLPLAKRELLFPSIAIWGRKRN